MDIEINLPDIGMEEAEITEILVNVGDKVNINQSIIVIEGDKTSIEIPSLKKGIVKELKVSIGDKVTIGHPIMILKNNDFDSIKNTISKNNNINTDSNEIKVIKILVKIGDKIKVNQILIILKSQNSYIEILSPCLGIIKEINTNIGNIINNELLITILNKENKLIYVFYEKKTIILDSLQKKYNYINNNSYVHATPSIRRIAREFGINLKKIKSTGRNNRIINEDIKTYIKDSIKFFEKTFNKKNVCFDKEIKNKIHNCNEIEKITLSKTQNISGANIYKNWITIPHVTQFDEVDITEIESFRKQQNIELKEKINNKITILVFIMKAVAKALEILPKFNSYLSKDLKSLIINKYINIGVAVEKKDGLIVPVFRNVNKKGIIELSNELLINSQKARDGKLLPSNLKNGCFTISNLGNIGGSLFTPIINSPEVAILGVSRSSIKPIWNGEKFIARLMLPLSLSYDHRAIDGADGARFITFIKCLMSDIRRLIL